VELPACPKCDSVNRPSDANLTDTVVYIELVGHDYFCRVCSHAWPAAPPVQSLMPEV
jgi:hypothetical protein